MSAQERLFGRIIKIHDEIGIQIQKSHGDIKNTNLENLFQLTQQLESINVETNLPGVGHGIKTLIDNIRMNQLTIEALRELQNVTQDFINQLNPKNS